MKTQFVTKEEDEAMSEASWLSICVVRVEETQPTWCWYQDASNEDGIRENSK